MTELVSSGSAHKMSTSHKRGELEKQINEKRILEHELKQMKKGQSAYKQQTNSHIFFKEDVTKVFSECKKSLDELIEEYKQCELDEETTEEGGDADTLNF
ncbi:Hypothetical predicted protein [Mytilus galloprovincialis]|uniref:Uncharacterized protein n=2 Tax=Mytilus galloprovincialis TaxID=29158 RepID=A0A8B6EL34_MYTGA|nr:Hypothetical predicted protein [Mytilus galloprovincialis]